MKRLILAAGVAAMAITAPAVSQPGDRGGGKDRKTQVQKVQKSERGKSAGAQRTEARAQAPQRAERARGGERRAQAQQQRGQRAERARGSERRVQAQTNRERGSERARTERVREQRAQRNGRSENQRAVEQRAQRNDRGNQRDQAQRIQADRERALQVRDRRFEALADRDDRRFERMAERREVRIDRIRDPRDRRLARLAETRAVPLSQWDQLARGGVWLNGCPPGLAKKPVPCVPPGQVRNAVGRPVTALRDRVRLSQIPTRLRYAYRDTDDYYYRYGNGYVYRVDRTGDIVRALLPLFGLGLTVGQPFPAAYSNHYLPTGLQPFYAGDPYTTYRYANGYVYQVDPRTGLVAGVDPLLGYGHGYGQMMPVTYSAYNVPYQYRSLYYDTPDHYYRYAPGAIYQVDAETSLITAVAALLTNGLTVGQPLPAGYGAYNVPYDYRTAYYDTPNAMYRYANGNIYRVDPTTQLVTAIVASILT
jgi:hypothetical protein